MKKKIETSICDGIIKILKARICNEYNENDRFFSVREISQIYGVSNLTAQKIISTLAGMKLLRIVPKSGTFVLNSSDNDIRGKSKNILFLHTNERPFINENDTFHFNVFLTIEKELKTKKHSLFFKTLGTEFSELDEFLSENDIAGIVISSSLSSNIILSKDWPRFAQFGIPCAAYNFMPEGIDTVVPDYAEAARKSVAHFVSMGHRNIVYIKADRHVQRYQEWKEGFRRGIEENNLVNSGEEWLIDELDDKFRELSAMIKAGTHDGPTAAYIPNDLFIPEILRNLDAHKIRVPKDLSIISFYRRNPSAVPELCTFDTPSERIGVEAAKLLMTRIESGNKENHAVIKLLPVDFFPGKTCVRVAANNCSGRKSV